MYTALGEKSLCKTCTGYPRHIEEFENVREFTLSLSCPEVAKILLEKTEPVYFYDVEVDSEEEEFEDFELLIKLSAQQKSLSEVDAAADRVKKIFGDDIVIIK